MQHKWGIAHKKKKLFWAFLTSDNHEFWVWQWGASPLCDVWCMMEFVFLRLWEAGLLLQWVSSALCDSRCHYLCLYWSSTGHRNSQKFSLVTDALLFSLYQVALGLLQVTFCTLRMAKRGCSALELVRTSWRLQTRCQRAFWPQQEGTESPLISGDACSVL